MSDRKDGHVIRMHFDLTDGTMREWTKPYYMSTTGRMCGKFPAGLFNGMLKENLGVFHFEETTAEMYTTRERYHKDRAHFLTCVIRALKRQSKRVAFERLDLT